MLSYKQELTAAGLNERLASKTHDTTIAGRYTFSNTENCIDFNSGTLRVKGGGYVDKDFRVGQVLSVADLEIVKNMKIGSFSNLTTTGTNAELSATDKSAIILLDSNLESISTITGKANDKFLILVNSTGNDIELNHSDDSLVDTKIISSSGAPIKVKDSSFVLLFYCEPLSGWLVVNGGGGSGSGVMVVSDLTARNNIPEGTRTNGMLVQVISEDTIYKLIGLPAGATTTDANWDTVITGKASQVITNKDIDGGTASNTSRWTTPKGSIETLAALTRKEATLLYNTSGKRGMLDDGAVLKPIPDFGNLEVLKQFVATNMVASDFQVNPLVDTVSLTKVTNSLLGDCFELNVVNSTQPDGFTTRPVVDIAVPSGFRNQRVQFTYDYASEIAQGSIAFEILDQTNSVVLVSQTELQARPSATGINTKGFIYFTIPANCQALRIYMLRPSGSATITSKKFWFNNWEIKKFSQTLGPVKTDPVAFTPTGSLTTNTNYSGWWSREGAYLTQYVKVAFTGANTQGPLNINLPNGLQIDTSLLDTTAFANEIGIEGIYRPTPDYKISATTNGTNNSFRVIFYNTDTTLTARDRNPTKLNTVDTSVSVPKVVASGDTITVTIKVPIKGWSSTARYADYTLNQDVSFYATKNADQTGIAVNNSGALITFPSVRVDKASCYESNGYRAKSKDLYKIVGSAQLFGGNILASQSYEIRVYVNSVFRERIAAIYTNAAGMAENLSGECLIELEYNDLVQLYLYSTGNHSTNTLVLQPTTNMVVTKASTSQQLFAPIGPVVVSASNSSGQVIPTGFGGTIVTGWTKSVDTNGAFNAATGVFTSPEDGYYRFFVSLLYASTAQLINVEYAVMGQPVFTQTNGTYYFRVSGEETVFLAKGATRSIATYQASGSNKSLHTTSNVLTITKV